MGLALQAGEDFQAVIDFLWPGRTGRCHCRRRRGPDVDP
jgi:hypothetical protein